MTLPANIRVNIGAPFPAVVKATAGIALSRANGIWTIGLGYPQLGIQAPPPASNYNTDYVAIYDSLAQTYFRVPLADVAGSARAQRNVSGSGVTVTILPTDQILHLNLGTPTTITLPSYGLRNGVPLTFKDVGMQAQANPITVQAAMAETIDGFPAVTLAVNGQAITLTPANDGVNTGWFRE